MKLKIEMDKKTTYRKKVDRTNPLYNKEGIAVGFGTTTEAVDEATGSWFKVYVDGLSLLQKCNKPEYDLFLQLCSRISHGTGNVIELSVLTKNELKKGLNMSTQAFDRNLRSLQEKELIKKWANRTFLINPDVMYIGSERGRLEAGQVYQEMFSE